MDVVISAWIISVVIRTCFSLSEATNGCGMLKIIEPAFRNKDVVIFFQLSARNSPGDVEYFYWYFEEDTYWSSYTVLPFSSKEHSFRQHNATFIIVIKQADNDDQGSYFVYLMNKYRDKICQSDAVKLELRDIGSCGAVTTYGSANFIKGGTLSVSFIPATSTNYTWMFRPNKSTMSTGVKIDGSLIEELDGYLNNERVLKIHNITDSHTGAYFVTCQGHGNTNETWIIVIEPPREVHFTSPNKSFFGCEECLYAEYHKKLEVECSFTDGSEEESVEIQLNSLDGRKTVERANMLSRGRYAAAFNYLREYNHLANVTCQVSAPTLQQPLTVTSKLYVLRRPHTPILTLGFLKEDQSPNISCQSDNSRPPPKLFYKLGEQTIDVNQTNESYIDNNTGNSKYRSIASINSVKRSWNNKMVTCCLRHETLYSPLCSEAMTLYYEFPPSAVHLSFTNISTTTKKDDTINITCVVVNANPVCGATISANDVEISNVNVSHRQDSGGGMTTVVIASLNVVPEDDGKRVICTADCSVFATNQTDSFALDLRDGVTETHNPNTKSPDQSQMTVWIIPSVAAVIVLVAMGTVVLLCLRRKNIARREAKPTAERCANQVDTDGSHNRQVIEDVEYYNVVANENILERGQQQDAETDHVTYAAVIPKEKRAKQTGPANGQSKDCNTNADMHSSDQAQTKETELHYADLDLDTLATSADQRKISNVEYSAIDFELSAATRAEEIPRVDDTDQNGSTENIYMNE